MHGKDRSVITLHPKSLFLFLKINLFIKTMLNGEMKDKHKAIVHNDPMTILHPQESSNEYKKAKSKVLP